MYRRNGWFRPPLTRCAWPADQDQLGAGAVRPAPAISYSRIDMRREIGEFLCVALPKILGGLLQLALNLLLLQYFHPEEFGVIGVCVAMVVLSDAVLGAGIDMGVLRLSPAYYETRPQYSLQVQYAAWVMKVAGAAVVAIPLAFFAGQASAFLFGQPGQQTLLLLCSVSLLGLLLLRSAQLYYQVRRSFLAYGALDLIHTFLRYGGIAALLALGIQTPQRVVAVMAVAPLVVVVGVIIAFSGTILRVPFSSGAFSELLHVIRWYLLTTAVGAIIMRMDVLLVSAVGGAAQAGIFAAAQVMALVPHLIGTYLAVVCAPRVMPLWQQGRLPAVYRKSQIGLAGFCVGAYLLALLLLRPLAPLFLPPHYAETLTVLLVLLPSGLAALLTFPWTVSLLLFLRPRLLLLIDAASLPFLVPAYIMAIRQSGALGAAIVTTGFALCKTAALHLIAFRLLRNGAPAADPVRVAEQPAI